MLTPQISTARHSQIALAFRAGRASAGTAQIHNPYSLNGMMPESLASVAGSLWHAFEAGKSRRDGSISGAGTMLRNARYCMRRATDLGRA